MYNRSPAQRRRQQRNQSSKMTIKNLPGPRWMLFGMISASYVIFTVYILSFNQESCPKMAGTNSVEKNKVQVRGEPNEPGTYAKIVDASYYTAGEGADGGDDNSREATAKQKLGPIGKPMAVPNGGHEHQPQKPVVKLKQYDPDLLPHDKLLDRKLTVNTVFMVWCGRRWFEFHNYMAVLSVIKHLRPDLIKFYYNQYPVIDSWFYNTWFDELRDAYPFFHIEELPTSAKGCIGHSVPNMTFVYSLLTNTGGLYLNEHTILAKYPIEYRLSDFVFAYDGLTNHGFISAKAGLPGKHRIKNLLKSPNVIQVKCHTMGEYNAAKGNSVCVNVARVFYPTEIWQHPSDFARMIRTLFYGRPEAVDAQPSDEVLVPNIAHMVWIGGGRMDYLFYLGVLSLIYVAEVDMVYIHGNGPPSGHLWARVKDHPKVKIIYREVPSTIYGQEVRVLSHVTDIWRVDFMIRYGGIYVDTDTVFVQKLSKEIRSYDAVGAYDWTYWNPPFPDTINFGVALGKRNATYWHEFQRTMKWFKDDDWSWNGLRQPYRIKERRPDLCKIDPRLQVICFQYKCHPTWYPEYHNESIHHENSPSIKDWRKDAFVFHWTLPTPPELDNEELLLTAKTMAAEVGRNVLEKAGLLKEIQARYNNKYSVTKPRRLNSR